MTSSEDPVGLHEPLEQVIECVTCMVRNTVFYPLNDKILEFRENIELYAVIPDTPEGASVANDPRGYDITFNIKKLPDLVSTYKQTRQHTH